MSRLTALIPLPFKSMMQDVAGLYALHSASKEENAESLSRVYSLERTVIRMAIAGLAVLAVYGLGYSIKAVAVMTAVASLPATLIAAGSCLIYFNTINVTQALSLLAFKQIALSMAGILSGFFLLHNYRLVMIQLPTSVTPEGIIQGPLKSVILPFKGVVEHFIAKPLQDKTHAFAQYLVDQRRKRIIKEQGEFKC